MESRNSRNFSTSSSCSSGMTRPASASTLSSAWIGTPDPQRERHRVAGPRRHLHAAVEDQLGEEGALLQVRDPHLLQPPAQRADDVLEQVVRQRPRGLDALLLEGDRGGLHRADPDRQVAVAAGSRATGGWVGSRAVRLGLPRRASRSRVFLLLTVVRPTSFRGPARGAARVTASDALDATRATPRARASGRASTGVRPPVHPDATQRVTGRAQPVDRSAPAAR